MTDNEILLMVWAVLASAAALVCHANWYYRKCLSELWEEVADELRDKEPDLTSAAVLKVVTRHGNRHGYRGTEIVAPDRRKIPKGGSGTAPPKSIS